MAGIAAILSAVTRSQWRSLRSLGSIAGNNFFLFVLLLMQQPSSAIFFSLLIGGMILFPLSADPLRAVPRQRLRLWPLGRRRLLVVRLASVLLSPAAWVVAGLLVWGTRAAATLQFAVLAAVLQVALMASEGWLRRAPRWNPLRWVPAMPGRFGRLAQKDMRQILCTLDFWVALLLAAAGIAYRWLASAPDLEAMPVLAVMVVLALSTIAQCLFGLDGPGGIERYRLFPVRGWHFVLAKDAAFLAAAIPLVLALDATAGVTAAFAALAIGHDASVRHPAAQQRWRFTSGRLVPTGLIQAIGLFSAGVAAHRSSGLLWVAGSGAACAASALLYGFILDRRTA
jgi:hypothetical protein